MQFRGFGRRSEATAWAGQGRARPLPARCPPCDTAWLQGTKRQADAVRGARLAAVSRAAPARRRVAVCGPTRSPAPPRRVQARRRLAGRGQHLPFACAPLPAGAHCAGRTLRCWRSPLRHATSSRTAPFKAAVPASPGHRSIACAAAPLSCPPCPPVPSPSPPPPPPWRPPTHRARLLRPRSLATAASVAK